MKRARGRDKRGSREGLMGAWKRGKREDVQQRGRPSSLSYDRLTRNLLPSINS